MARKSAKAKEKEDFVNDEESGDDLGAEDGPPVVDPYEILGLEHEATADDVKKAYRKLALKHHPDKAAEGEKEAANKHFQEIAFAYAVLSDDRRRKRYDLTGSTAETLEHDDEFDWLKFYREQWEDVINEEAIKKVADEFKGSSEERAELIKAYKKCKGNLAGIYQIVMLSDILEDDDRFRQILDESIANGTIDAYPTYAQETDETRQKAKDTEKKRREDFDKKQAAKVAKEEAEEEAVLKTNGKVKPKPKAKKSGAGDMADLAALIQQRQKSRAGNFFDALEAKYAPKSRGSKRSTPMDEPPEEAFQATAARKKQKAPKKKLDDNEDMDMDDEEVDASDEEEYVKPRKSKAKAKARPRRAKA